MLASHSALWCSATSFGCEAQLSSAPPPSPQLDPVAASARLRRVRSGVAIRCPTMLAFTRLLLPELACLAVHAIIEVRHYLIYGGTNETRLLPSRHVNVGHVRPDQQRHGPPVLPPIPWQALAARSGGPRLAGSRGLQRSAPSRLPMSASKVCLFIDRGLAVISHLKLCELG
jgi:hypothetical protein